MTTACWIGVGCIALFFVLSLMGVKICYSMLASGIVGILLLSGLKGAMAVVSTALFSMVSSFDYAVLPMFILMATIITESGMGTSLYASCRTWLGHLPGGLCIATIIACAVFAAVTAFPWASIMAVGAIALPDMFVLGRAVHAHPLDHDGWDAHFTSGDDPLFDAFHTLLSLRGALAEVDEILAHQRKEVDGLELYTVFGGGLQIAVLNPFVVQGIGVGGAAGVRQLHPGESGLLGHL